MQQIEIGTPVIGHFDKRGVIAEVKAARKGLMMIDGGGLTPVKTDIVIAWIESGTSQVSEQIAAPWIAHAARLGISKVDNVDEILTASRTHESEQAASAANEHTRQETERADFESIALTRVPSWAQSVLVAELVEDKSDLMSDYHGSTTRRTIILAFSKHNRDLFSEMRKAAVLAPETEHLVDTNADFEHRQKYSMGAGYFLKDGGRNSDGWKVSKRQIDRANIRTIPRGEWAEHFEIVADITTKPAQSVVTQTGITVEEHTHTKKGFQMFVCIMPERVERDEFNRLRDVAQALGGWYSRKWGKTPAGFAFKDETSAKSFANPEPTPSPYKALDKNGHEYERAPQTVGELPHSQTLAMLQKIATAQNIEKISFGVPVYIGLGLTKTQAENDPRSWILKSGGDLPLTLADKPKPSPANKLRNLADAMEPAIEAKLADRLSNTPKRQKQAAESRIEGRRLQRTRDGLNKIADLHDAGNVPALLVPITSKKAAYDLAGAHINRENTGYYDAGREENRPNYNTPQALAFWELLSADNEAANAQEALRQKVDALQFAQIPGYFPTPAPVVQQMLEHAKIPADVAVKILEPSAGSGAILDELRERLPLAEIDAIERHLSLRDVLQLKGYELSGHDFEQHEPQPEYDFVLMNPPFEHLQDAGHVRHAFDCLKNGGRLVAIMSPAAFFRVDAKAQAFREWFELLDGYKVDLPDGSFKASGTGVASVMVTIDKAEG